ncbi:MAG: pantoate--beta-alanine ligase [Paraperlucidibaca sp.]
MKIEYTIQGVRAALRSARKSGKSIAFVPTMGNLHKGHIQLIHEAKRRADYVVCSIFVNPTQFGANEDFATYPRTLERDGSLLAEADCDLVFAPDATEMYSNGLNQLTSVQVDHITEHLCGASRPGHFSGMATVVTKLLNIISPDMALFGQKDYQQLCVIKQLVHDLCLAINIIGIATVRDNDGLALSSRNQYLTELQRSKAPVLYKTLCSVRDSLQQPNSSASEVIAKAKVSLKQAGFKVDYLSVHTLTLTDFDPSQAQAVVLAAAHLGKTRLIDNLIFDLQA